VIFQILTLILIAMNTTKIFFIIIFTAISILSYSQQDNTLYFMNRVPQVNLANPANGYECKVNVYGILMPVFGQLPPPMSINLGHTGFSLKKAFKKGDILTVDADSSGPGNTINTSDSLVPDFDYLLKAMRPINYITGDIQILLLGGGFKYEDWYFSVGLTEKINFSLGYPKDLIGLIWKGNGAYIDEPARFSGLGMNFTHYREFLTGVQRKMNDKLKLGANVKWLFGKSNVYTRKSDIRLHTDPNTFDLQMISDLEINASLPEPIYIDYSDGSGIADSLSFNLWNRDSLAVGDSTSNISPSEILNSKYFLNRKNFGLGLDLGAIYQITDKIEVQASIIDIGFIRWKANTYSFKQNGNYTYTGVDFPPYLNKNNNIDSIIKAWGDSVYSNFMVTHNQKAYNSFLPTKIYIGGTYKYNDFVNFGLLTRTEIYQRSLHPSFTLSVNTNFYKWLSATFTYSMINRYWMNMGLGIAAKASFMQFYIITDNFFGIRSEASTGIPLPYSARNVNFRFGCNLIFGCPKQVTKSFL